MRVEQVPLSHSYLVLMQNTTETHQPQSHYGYLSHALRLLGVTRATTAARSLTTARGTLELHTTNSRVRLDSNSKAITDTAQDRPELLQQTKVGVAATALPMTLLASSRQHEPEGSSLLTERRTSCAQRNHPEQPDTPLP